jgi:hypothetical protein
MNIDVTPTPSDKTYFNDIITKTNKEYNYIKIGKLIDDSRGLLLELENININKNENIFSSFIPNNNLISVSSGGRSRKKRMKTRKTKKTNQKNKKKKRTTIKKNK